MPTLFRFLMIVGLFVGSIAGGLYVLAEYFQPEPKEISKALRHVRVRADEQTTGSAPGTAAPAPSADAGETTAPVGDITGRAGSRRAQ
ncbi:MAG: hypothetical protein ABWY38_01200 [Methyloceanibacter sp.]